MAIVFEANYSKKLGLPGFSSHQYSVTVRCEVADIKQVPAESNRIYKLLQDSVDKEIQHPGFLPNGSGNGGNGSNGHQEHKDNGKDPWECSEKQKDLILKIVAENGLDKQTVFNAVKSGVPDLHQRITPNIGVPPASANAVECTGGPDVPPEEAAAQEAPVAPA